MAKTPRLKNASKRTFRQLTVPAYGFLHCSSILLNSSSNPQLTRSSQTRSCRPTRFSISSSIIQRPPIPFLAPSQHAGISKKKKKKQKPLKRRQRVRLELGKEKAENVQGRTEAKMIGSKGRGERRKARRADWEDIDEKIGREVGSAERKGKGKKQVIEGQEVGSNTDSAAVAAASKDLALDKTIQGLDVSDREDPSTALELDEEVS